MQLNFQDTGHRISRIITIILAVAGIAMIAVYAIEGDEGPLHRMQQATHAFMAPAEQAGAAIGAAADAAEDGVADVAADEETLTALRERNAELTQLLTQAEEYRLESERLRDLLELKDIYKLEGVSARIIGRSTDAWNQTVTLDAGEDEGVSKGLTVMGPAGVIGQVVEVSASSCVVRLLTDPNSGVAAQVQSSRVEGIVRGSLTGALELENVDADAEVSQGDVVLTSGLGGSFTKGLLIGTVVRVEGSAKDGTRVIVVAPNEEAASLEEVMVVFSATESASIIRASDATAPSDEGGQSEGGGQGGNVDADATESSGEGRMIAAFASEIIGAVIAVILQAIIAPYLTIGSVVPNIAMAFAVAFSVASRRTDVCLMPFLVGLAFDLLGSGPVGGMALLCLGGTLLATNLTARFGDDSLFMPVVSIVVSILLIEVLYALIYVTCGWDVGLGEALLYRSLPGWLYDTVVALVVYAISRFILRPRPTEMDMTSIG